MIEKIKKHFKKIVIAILGIFTLTAAAATVLMVPQGGTGINSVTGGSYLKGAGTGALVERNAGEVKTDLSLNLVENTALSTWAGSGNITTIGTLGSLAVSGGKTELTETSAGALNTQLRLRNLSNTAGTGARISFRAYDSISSVQTYGRISVEVDDGTNPQEDGTMRMSVFQNGVATDYLVLNGNTGTVSTAKPITASGGVTGDVTGDLTGNADTATATTVWLTNKSGGALTVNTTVVIDTGNNNAITTTTSSANKRVIGVIKTGGADNAQVEVQIAGIVSVKIAAVVPGPGYFLRTATSAGYVYASGTSGAAGDFLISLQGGGPGATITAMFKPPELL